MTDSDAAIGVRTGDVLAGKYRVDGLLGVGGTGVVLAAYHLQLDERVALKFLAGEARENPEASVRFVQEARAAVKITSEHVARVRDVCALADGTPYIVMEFLEGSDLSVWLAEKGPLPVEQAVDFVLQAGEAIAEAHCLGIIHRDLKPSNLFVVRRSDGVHSVKVLDFGISKMPAGSNDFERTGKHMVMGSPHYMSPEQLRSSARVTPQSDLWSLGIILYELMAGTTPFSGQTFPEICIQTTMEPAPPLRSIRPDAPRELEAVVARCLEKDPAHRFADVADLAVALQPFAPVRARASVERIVSTLRGSTPPEYAPAIAHSTPPCVIAVRTTGPCERRPPDRSPRDRSTTVAFPFLALLAGFALAVVASGASPQAGASSPSWGIGPSPLASAEANTPVRLASLPSWTDSAVVPPSCAVTTAELPPFAHVADAGNDTAGSTQRPEVAASSPRRPRPLDCQPPFYFDANGIRVFKKECVR